MEVEGSYSGVIRKEHSEKSENIEVREVRESANGYPQLQAPQGRYIPAEGAALGISEI
jgi:hypothetical protein